MTENDLNIFWRYSLLLLLTWPLHLIRVPKIFWCRDKHLSIGDRRPERNHIKSPVMSDGSILLRVHNLTCLMAKQDILFSTHLTEDHPPLPRTHVNGRTWLVPAQPLIENGVCEGVQQHKDGVIGWEVSLSACPIEKKMGQVVEAADYGVIHPLGCTVA